MLGEEWIFGQCVRGMFVLARIDRSRAVLCSGIALNRGQVDAKGQSVLPPIMIIIIIDMIIIIIIIVMIMVLLLLLLLLSLWLSSVAR